MGVHASMFLKVSNKVVTVKAFIYICIAGPVGRTKMMVTEDK